MLERPKNGEPIRLEDVREIFNRYKTRSRLCPEEDPLVAFSIVVLNFGAQFATVSCINEDHGWTSTLSEAVKTGSHDLPVCPMGHVLMVHADNPTIGWVKQQ